MEFNEKLQELRKKKGLTQEELSKSLYVSRTAVSKWESGRGYPNTDSLKEIAKFFSVTVDYLLSSSEVLTIAEEEQRKKEGNFRNVAFGVLDVSFAMLLFLPFFAERKNGLVQAVSLVSLTEISLCLRICYFAVVIGAILFGILTFALQNCQNSVWIKSKKVISLSLSVIAVLCFIASLQVYATVFTFVLLVIKGIMLIKWK